MKDPANMYDPTSLNLPAFASVPDLLDTVIADCRALFKDPNYLPTANEWHTQILDEYENPQTCAVCVAGGFLVRQLEPPKDQTLFPSDYPPRVAHLFYSINGLRQGLVKDELVTLLHLLPEKSVPKELKDLSATTPIRLRRKLKEAHTHFSEQLNKTGQFTTHIQFDKHLQVLASLSAWLRQNVQHPGFDRPLPNNLYPEVQLPTTLS